MPETIWGMRKNFVILLGLFFYTICPVLSVCTASLLALIFDCRVNEAGPQPCDCFGSDIGGLLVDMTVFGWLALLTLPTGLAAMLTFCGVRIVQSLKPQKRIPLAPVQLDFDDDLSIAPNPDRPQDSLDTSDRRT